MTKLLFCLQTMVCGGVEKELITILKRFNPNEYDVTVLFLYQQETEMLESLPESVRLVDLDIDPKYFCGSTTDIISTRLKKGHVLEAGQIAVEVGFRHKSSPAVISLDGMPALPERYDAAVCYHVHSPTVLRYVVEKVNAKKRIAWIHNDFSTTGFRVQQYARWLNCYDLIVGVSRRLSDEFSERCPELKDRTITVHNIVDSGEITEKAQDQSEVEPEFLCDKRFKLLTVGRFVQQKGFDIAIKACVILKSRGVNLAWYAIGYGEQERSMRTLIHEQGLDDTFVILGRKDNPYPYMANVDLYVQPSRHEGYAITIEEAKALDKLIVCTDFAGASEQLENGKNGVIVPTCTPEAIAAAIERLFLDGAYRDELLSRIRAGEKTDGWRQIEELFQV